MKEETIRDHGAVSEQCAIELADNIRICLSADIGISFTGVAGPDSLEGQSCGYGVDWAISTKDRKLLEQILLQLAGSRNESETINALWMLFIC